MSVSSWEGGLRLVRIVARVERDGYWEPPRVGSEVDTLLGSLERMRATFWFKCSALGAEELATRIANSELSLGRLLKHLAYMEDLNFTRDMAGLALPEPWASISPDVRSQWVFESADADSASELYGLWTGAVGRSRAAARDFVQHHGMEGTYRVGDVTLSGRRLLVDMIEEYGRHTGHADLLREHVDGRTGEDPPGPARRFTLPGPDHR